MNIVNTDYEYVIMGIELYAGRKIVPERTLLIFDEVQEVPRALASLLLQGAKAIVSAP